MRPVELESRLEKGSRPPRSAASLFPTQVGPGRGAFTLRAFVSHRDPDWSANRPHLPAGRPNLDQLHCDLKIFRHAEVEPARRILVAGARAGRTPRPHIPRGRRFKSCPRYQETRIRTPN